MKKRQLENLRKKSIEVLVKSSDSLRSEIRQLYAKKAAGETSNLKEIKLKRHELATMLNIISEKSDEPETKENKKTK